MNIEVGDYIRYKSSEFDWTEQVTEITSIGYDFIIIKVFKWLDEYPINMDMKREKISRYLINHNGINLGKDSKVINILYGK